jgi:SAM-dependent methyltransferase
MAVDFGKTASDYGRHRAGFPARLFDELAARGVGRPGQTILDLGTGTGSLARGFARLGAAVIGLDPSAAMLAEARRLAAAEGVAVDFREGRAETTGLPDARFEVVAAGQCWHWFDRPAAAVEARRLLRPGGRLAICHFDWIPLAGNPVAATEALIEAHNPAWAGGGGTGLHPAWLADAAEAGFAGLETFSFDLAVPYSHAAWCGRIRASAGVGASLPPDAVERFDRDLAALLAERFPEDPLQAPHRAWALLATAP